MLQSRPPRKLDFFTSDETPAFVVAALSPAEGHIAIKILAFAHAEVAAPGDNPFVLCSRLSDSLSAGSLGFLVSEFSEFFSCVPVFLGDSLGA